MSCSICLEENEDNFIYPKHCSCKVYFHEKCLNKCKEYGINCPICRKKLNIQIVNYRNDFHDILHDLERPIEIFRNNPNFFTFIFVFLYTIIITFLVLVPVAIYIFYPKILYFTIIVLCIIIIIIFLI